MKDASLQPVPCSTRGSVQPYTVKAAAVDIEMQSEGAEVDMEMQSEAAAVDKEMQSEAAEVDIEMQSKAAAVDREMQSEAAEVDREMQSEAAAADIEMQSEAADVDREMQSEAAAADIEMQPEAAEVERKMQSAVDDEPSVTEQSDEAAARKFAWENCIELAASDTVLEKHTEVAGIISDQCSQVVGEVYALPLTLAQHDNQLVLPYSPLDSTVAMENAGEIQPLSSSNVVHSEGPSGVA